MLKVYTGRSRLLSRALVECVRRADDETELIVVPKQLTLATEQLLLGELGLKGSFRIQVLSAERLCARIFESAGSPDGARIDDRGRVMLVRAAVRAAEERLTIYRGAQNRRGFPERAASQLERIRQANLSGETLRACAEELRGAAKLKLVDLSYILEEYESLIAGRYQDGEEEFLSAIARAQEAEFLSGCGVWFYGFDMMPPTLHGLIAAVAARSAQAGLFLALENDTGARDFDAFLPIQHAMEQVMAAARQCGCAVRRIEIAEWDEADERLIRSGDQLSVRAPKRRDALKTLERELFAFPAKRAQEATPAIQLTLLRYPQEECRFAAALARRLVIQKNWRWNDITILARDAAGYAPMLKNAFSEYGIPIFLSESRPAARHAAAEYLLTALKAIEKNYPAEEMLALMGTDMSPLNECESERFINYAVRCGLRGARFSHALRRGLEAEIAEMEPLRARLMAPLMELREGLKAAKTLDGQLQALVQFLESTGAYEKSQSRMNALADAGLREAAGEEAQVWNRIMGALDQMHALMGENRLSLRELRDTLNESLSASVIKPLPQSADAVYAQSAERACARETKALILIGMTDRAATGDDGLLTPPQKRALSEFAHAYLGPDDADLTRLRRFYLKSSFGMASDYVSVSCPLSGADGASQRPSAVFEMIRALYPGMKLRGGVTGEEGIERMLRSSPRAAVALVASALAGEGEGTPMTKIDCAALAGLKKLADSAAGGSLSPALSEFDTQTRAARETGAAGEASAARAFGNDALRAADALNADVSGSEKAAGAPITNAARDAETIARAPLTVNSDSAGNCAAQDTANSHAARAGLERLSAALNRAQAADALSPEAARALYGAIRRQSVTRLERFAACPFSYYVEYGLKPERIEPYELSAKDEGTFFHAAIHEFLLRSMGDLNALDAPAAEARMDAVTETLLQRMGESGPLGDSAVSLAETRRLKATMRVSAVALAEHMRGSRFHAAALEQSFGPEDGARAIRLDGDCVLEGRIDRIDEWDEADKYLRVIDFKRGGKTFKLATVYYGLQLQLPVYLASALARRGGRSAGVYYFPLEEGILTTQSLDSGEIERERRAVFRMEGLIPESEEVRRAMTDRLGEVFKARATEDGKLYKNVPSASESDYRAMTDCALRRASEQLRDIRRGVCGAFPVRFEGIDPCRYCNYRSVCLFDDRLDAARVRRPKTLSIEEAMLKMKLEQEPGAQTEENGE